MIYDLVTTFLQLIPIVTFHPNNFNDDNIQLYLSLNKFIFIRSSIYTNNFISCITQISILICMYVYLLLVALCFHLRFGFQSLNLDIIQYEKRIGNPYVNFIELS